MFYLFIVSQLVKFLLVHWWRGKVRLFVYDCIIDILVLSDGCLRLLDIIRVILVSLSLRILDICQGSILRDWLEIVPIKIALVVSGWKDVSIYISWLLKWVLKLVFIWLGLNLTRKLLGLTLRTISYLSCKHEVSLFFDCEIGIYFKLDLFEISLS